MPARKGPKKVNKYSLELKRTAVRLTQAPGARVKDVAESLEIHPLHRALQSTSPTLSPRLPLAH
jgi:transposase-like protein